MKRLLLAALLFAAPPASAHGSLFRGSGDLRPATLQGTPEVRNLSRWSFWWAFNKPHFCTKSSLGRSRSPGGQHESAAPEPSTRNDVEHQVLPALRGALASSSSDQVTAAILVALGRSAQPKSSSDLLKLLGKATKSESEPIQLAAIQALGLFGDPHAVPELIGILQDAKSTARVFAATSLGLLGGQATNAITHQAIAAALIATIAADDSSTDDIQIACIVALGFVQLDEAIPGDTRERKPSTSHAKLAAYLLNELHDAALSTPVRAQIPLALSHLFDTPRSQQSRAEVTGALLEVMQADPSKTPIEKPSEQLILQSCALALGQLGGSDPAGLDARIRAALFARATPETHTQLYGFALVALAQLGDRCSGTALASIATHIEAQLAQKDIERRSWAGLAAGLFARTAGQATPASMLATLQANLAAGRTPLIGAFTIGAALSNRQAMVPTLLTKFEESTLDTARGNLALALGMLRTPQTSAFTQLYTKAKYRPTLRMGLASALGQLEDKQSLDFLLKALPAAKSPIVQGAIAPLCAQLADEDNSPRARALAATTLGLLAGKRPRPWHDEYARHFNYRAATKTLLGNKPLGLLLRL